MSSGFVTCLNCGSLIKKKKKFSCNKCGKMSANCIICNRCGGDIISLCPICAQKNPKKLFDFDKEIRIRLTGDYCSGKTTYYVTLLKEIKEKMSTQMVISAFDKDTNEKWQENYIAMNNHKSVYATPVGYLAPSRWELISRKENRISKSRKRYLINFIDRASEMFLYENKDNINPSDYIFILIDITEVMGTHDIVEKISDLSRNIIRAMDLPITKRIENPVAVIFTKMDLLVYENDGELEKKLSINTMDNNNFFSHDFYEDSIKIKEWMINNNKEEVLNVLDFYFNDYLLFVSSCLTNIKNKSAVPPKSTLNPFLWILMREKFR